MYVGSGVGNQITRVMYLDPDSVIVGSPMNYVHRSIGLASASVIPWFTGLDSSNMYGLSPISHVSGVGYKLIRYTGPRTEVTDESPFLFNVSDRHAIVRHHVAPNLDYYVFHSRFLYKWTPCERCKVSCFLQITRKQIIFADIFYHFLLQAGRHTSYCTRLLGMWVR